MTVERQQRHRRSPGAKSPTASTSGAAKNSSDLQRDVLAERHEVHLAVDAARACRRADEERRVVVARRRAALELVAAEEQPASRSRARASTDRARPTGSSSKKNGVDDSGQTTSRAPLSTASRESVEVAGRRIVARAAPDPTSGPAGRCPARCRRGGRAGRRACSSARRHAPQAATEHDRPRPRAQAPPSVRAEATSTAERRAARRRRSARQAVDAGEAGELRDRRAPAPGWCRAAPTESR